MHVARFITQRERALRSAVGHAAMCAADTHRAFVVTLDDSAWPRVHMVLQGAPSSNEECESMFLARLAAQYARCALSARRPVLELVVDVADIALLRAAKYFVNVVEFLGSAGARSADDVTVGTVIMVAPGAEAPINRLVALMPGSRPRAFVGRGDNAALEAQFRVWRARRGCEGHT